MWLAGIPVADRAVLRLAASLREAKLVDTAELLAGAYHREARIVALDGRTIRWPSVWECLLRVSCCSPGRVLMPSSSWTS